MHSVDLIFISFVLVVIQKDESTDAIEKTWMHAFNEGYDCLSMRPEYDDLLKKGITEAISLQKVLLAVYAAIIASMNISLFFVNLFRVI